MASVRSWLAFIYSCFFSTIKREEHHVVVTTSPGEEAERAQHDAGRGETNAHRTERSGIITVMKSVFDTLEHTASDLRLNACCSLPWGWRPWSGRWTRERRSWRGLRLWGGKPRETWRSKRSWRTLCRPESPLWKRSSSKFFFLGLLHTLYSWDHHNRFSESLTEEQCLLLLFTSRDE